MQFKKTPLGKRITYTYKYADGHSVTLHSGQDGVVEADICPSELMRRCCSTSSSELGQGPKQMSFDMSFIERI